VVPVLVYAEIAGGSVPATRALLMYAAVAAAILASRPVDGLRALAAAAIALVIAVPDIGADIGFELSFVSVAALIVTMRWRSARRSLDAPAPARRSAVGRHVLTALSVSFAAGVATAPLTAWHFQQVSLVAPLANLLVLPLLGPATLLPGLAALPLVPVAPAIADLLLRLAGGAAALGLWVASALAPLPGAAVTTPMPNLVELGLCYMALGLPFVPHGRARSVTSIPRRPWHSRVWSVCLDRPRPLVACALIAATLADIGYWTWERFGNAHLRVTFLSVGQGDAAVVELPRGRVMVIDGGGFAGSFDTGERLVAPFLRSRKIRRVDTLVLSHPQLDHYGGLTYLAEHFRPREFWWNGVRAEASGFAQLERALARAGTRSIVLRRGAPAIVDGEVVFEVLHPHAPSAGDLNNGSLVLRLTHGGASFLFSGDIEREAEDVLARLADRQIVAPAGVVLKVPHHGSATSSSTALLDVVRPRVAVISSGADNRFGFPAPAVLARLHAAGAVVWRTDLDGAIRVESDGARMTIATPCGERPRAEIDLKSHQPADSS
jgi:competence protein ComEC